MYIMLMNHFVCVLVQNRRMIQSAASALLITSSMKVDVMYATIVATELRLQMYPYATMTTAHVWTAASTVTMVISVIKDANIYA